LSNFTRLARVARFLSVTVLSKRDNLCGAVFVAPIKEVKIPPPE